MWLDPDENADINEFSGNKFFRTLFKTADNDAGVNVSPQLSNTIKENSMSHQHVIKAWKDPAYRNTLSPTERAALPANPAGAIEISDEVLGHFAGAIYNPPPPTGLCLTQIACPYTRFPVCSNSGCPSLFYDCPTLDACPPLQPF